VPVSVTDALVAGVATFTCNVAFLRPLEVGANVTLTVQNAPAARLVPQLLFCVHELALPPAVRMLVNVSATELVLVTVIA